LAATAQSWIAATSVVTEMLHLEAFGDWFDPQRVRDPMHDRPVARCCFDTSVAILSLALPFPATVLVFLDFAEEAFFEASLTRARV
jgi:hypothetical protein